MHRGSKGSLRGHAARRACCSGRAVGSHCHRARTSLPSMQCQGAKTILMCKAVCCPAHPPAAAVDVNLLAHHLPDHGAALNVPACMGAAERTGLGGQHSARQSPGSNSDRRCFALTDAALQGTQSFGRSGQQRRQQRAARQLYAVHSPGRPGPQGLSQVGSPGLAAFHSAKSAAPRLRSSTATRSPARLSSCSMVGVPAWEGSSAAHQVKVATGMGKGTS